MTLTLGFSPCPNDTFIFDALVNQRINTHDIRFEVVLEDVQTLNQWAMQQKLDVSKISYGVLPLVHQHYQVLRSGGALGMGVGPLLISNSKPEHPPVSAEMVEEVTNMRIAIPGEQTTAHMLFSTAFPHATKKQFMLFSDIEQAVLDGVVDAGVIIHENRFTYQEIGLHQWVDLGAFWEEKTLAPIPLGGIIMRREFDNELKFQVQSMIRDSAAYALDRYPAISAYVKQHAQTMQESVMRQHIDLYVNDFSLDLGEAGASAIKTLFSTYNHLHHTRTPVENLLLAR